VVAELLQVNLMTMRLLSWCCCRCWCWSRCCCRIWGCG